VRWRLGPQVLQLCGRRGTLQHLVAVRVAPKARYDVAGCPGLRDPKLVERLEVRGCFGRFLLGVEDAALVEGEVLRVANREPEEPPLHGPQLSVHPQVDAFEGQLKGLLVL
jgi:hypothetical protein